MRILQLIDSLQPGGAERMAVNYANRLSGKIAFSGLVTTRAEGGLIKEIGTDVSYLYLHKKYTIDFYAIFKLRKFVKENRVEVIHAHSTSFFLAFLLKLTCPKIRLIWHDHYGDSEFLSERPGLALRLIIPFFDGCVVVNQKLKSWATEKIRCNKVIYLPNFPDLQNNDFPKTKLEGISGKKIICLANLREQKNHGLLLEIAAKLKKTYPEWTFHLVGKDFDDGYSRQIKKKIIDDNLEKNVFIYGSKPDIASLLQQAEIAILTSKSEGLPVALLEYGLYSKSVVVPNVGEIATIVKNDENGILISESDAQLFYEAIVKNIASASFRNEAGARLHDTIIENYSGEAVINKYLSWVKE